MAHAPQQDRRGEREARRRQRKDEAAAEQLRQMESNAKWLYHVGFFALPLMWLILLVYYHREHVDDDASQIIKRYYIKSRFMLVVYTALFVVWFVVFQVKSDSLSALDILSLKNRSPSGI